MHYQGKDISNGSSYESLPNLFSSYIRQYAVKIRIDYGVKDSIRNPWSTYCILGMLCSQTTIIRAHILHKKRDSLLGCTYLLKEE